MQAHQLGCITNLNSIFLLASYHSLTYTFYMIPFMVALVFVLAVRAVIDFER